MINKAIFGKVKKAILTSLSKAEKSICKPFRITGKFIVKQRNFRIADFSLKRIYKNSEGHIIPLIGGVLALSIFHSINYLIYSNAVKDSNVVGGKAALASLIVFITLLFIAWIVIYQIKKANLRDDITNEVKRKLIKYYDPYNHIEDKEQREIWLKVYPLSSEVKYVLDKFIEYKKLKYNFSATEFTKMKENIIIEIKFHLEKHNAIPPDFESLMHEDMEDIFSDIEGKDQEIGDWIYIIKEGNRKNPKNLDSFKIDIEERNPPFVVFEHLNDKKGGKSKFYDVNTEHITHAEYIVNKVDKVDKVKLTIAQPKSPSKKITVSLREWLANRNDLR